MQFTAHLIYWRGPAPHYFLPVPGHLAAELKEAANLVSYGWGMIPVTVTLEGWRYDTSLFPRQGGYLLPVRAEVRRAAGWTEGDEG
ncbi:DUF1905 domain-containing protein [Deinococcus radiophilus]|uniref:DUF1905 domain-containing protein n=1 Tax=Deinococcus radiophilus TaxID=32062 RepID=A0A3S0K541_9DEIO|nr:DUF1905 domain-containing protein [Deinococcus radiophilus]RTR20509.1 DUF1905 domain-containing protein [Deinococcus radiophilus]UFA51476.1 DUF1905 domain-containing protein [Deinococcus radiophilus]